MSGLERSVKTLLPLLRQAASRQIWKERSFAESDGPAILSS